MGGSAAAGATGGPARRALVGETLLVLGVGLGSSAIYAVLAIVRRLTEAESLDRQTSSLNAAVTPDRPWLDLAYQLAGVGLGVVPALLAVYLLGAVAPRPAGRPGTRAAAAAMGLDARRPGSDLLLGAGLALVIGVPGLGVYLGARALGLNTTVSAAGLADVWWAVPVLVLAALGNAFLEEVVMIGYLFARWSAAGAPVAAVLLTSALVRGTYHLYQGFGGFAGNVAMGVILGLVYLRMRRVAPLVVAHTLLDVVAFVGYALLAPHVGWL
ncbi:CPBP family intramembrane glutamic endopeptidase [Agilicoccus flavus]|uniref:CPBP family intramembrane glutamic endopeptidase n=1 Tax=Agilicoccus flavus TaxID=2775968 RepID=UPI001CF71C4F|nr:CPBP family intramembrane glutamic endopeptidase [Agilicoccus flavus]